MRKLKPIFSCFVILFLLFGSWNAFVKAEDEQPAGDENAQEENNDQAENTETEVVEEEVVVADSGHVLPDEDTFKKVAENNKLILKANKDTGHFIVENKESKKVLRSFPSPENWESGNTADVWRTHLLSPFMFTYVEFNIRKDVVKESNYLNQGGESTFKEIEDGFRIDYTMPNVGFTIPVEVKLGEDFVETKILGDEIIDDVAKEEKDPKSRLVSLKLFPFLGSDTSDNEEGYLLLPDGPGALVKFEQNRANSNNIYTERIYGEDIAFSINNAQTSRQSVKMPIFGIKSNHQTFLGVVREGDVYASIQAAPSETLTHYNWVTAEHLFRYKFFQPTNRRSATGFYTYSNDMQRETRSIRYYVVDGDDPTYVDMAERYREYLMDEYELSKVEEQEHIALQLSLLGGGTKSGFIRDSFLAMTETDQAKKIVNELNSSGIDRMDIQYLGWQRGGYDNSGGHFPVAKKLGGNDGMKEFIDFANNKGFQVYLDTSSYTFNNTNKDGFRPNRDGLRDLSSTIIKGYSFWDHVWVSPKFMQKVIEKDFKKAKELNTNGYLYGDGIGHLLSTDYNDNYQTSRQETMEIQQDIIQKTKEEIGKVRIDDANFYGLANINHITNMDSEYSYDLFVDDTVPFAQIALHGLITYSLDYANMSKATNDIFLKGIEYGALPSFILTYGQSHDIVESRSLRRFYSTYYKDWEEEIVTQYQNYNEALADVQDQFIVDHEKVNDGVFVTTYENGKRVYVNYNSRPYVNDGLVVEAESFAIEEGGI